MGDPDVRLRIGSPRRFTIGEDLEAVWAEYTAQNDEKHFRKFVSGVVSAWDNQVSPNWEMLVSLRIDERRDDGPESFPDELLPALR